jgi:hypothetical protein
MILHDSREIPPDHIETFPSGLAAEAPNPGWEVLGASGRSRSLDVARLVDASECGFCGESLPKRSGPGQPRLFCDDLCRGRAKSGLQTLKREEAPSRASQGLLGRLRSRVAAEEALMGKSCMFCRNVALRGSSRCRVHGGRKQDPRTTNQRGLGGDHQALRLQALKLAGADEAGLGGRCAECGQPGVPGNPLEGGHVVPRALGSQTRSRTTARMPALQPSPGEADLLAERES